MQRLHRYRTCFVSQVPGLEPADVGWPAPCTKAEPPGGGDALPKMGGQDSQGYCAPLQKFSQHHLEVEQGVEAKLSSCLLLLDLKESPGTRRRQQQ